MKLVGEHVFNGPREEVWELVRDPAVLATALPGTQDLNQVSENEYAGKMHVRVGPVSGVFAGRVVVADEVPPESYTLSVEGRGGPGFARGSGNVQLVDQGDGTTLMKYQGELQIGGRIASVGQRLIESVSKSMTRQGLEALNKALQARLSGEGTGVADEEDTAKVDAGRTAERKPAEYKPPSETEFAAAVVKDVASDMAADIFSPENLNTWIAVTAAIIGVVVGFWLGSTSVKRR
jgi:carbon monoxide dehydrogenase subunit G